MESLIERIAVTERMMNFSPESNHGQVTLNALLHQKETWEKNKEIYCKVAELIETKDLADVMTFVQVISASAMEDFMRVKFKALLEEYIESDFIIGKDSKEEKIEEILTKLSASLYEESRRVITEKIGFEISDAGMGDVELIKESLRTIVTGTIKDLGK